MKIVYEHSGVRCEFVGRRDSTGELQPPTQEDFHALVKGPGLFGMTLREWQTWAAGLTVPGDWRVWADNTPEEAADK